MTALHLHGSLGDQRSSQTQEAVWGSLSTCIQLRSDSGDTAMPALLSLFAARTPACVSAGPSGLVLSEMRLEV